MWMSTSVPRRRRACKLSQEHMSPHYNDTKASALCSEFIVLRVSIKGPGTLKGLVKFSGSPGDWSYKDADDENDIKSVQQIFSVALKVLFFLDHFSIYMASSHYGCFLTQKCLLLDPPRPGITPGWGIKVSKTSFLIAWGVFWPIIQFTGGLKGWYGSLPWWLILNQKRAFFGRPLTWKWHLERAKWPQATFPYV